MICIYFTPFFTAVYIVEQLVLQKIYVVNKEGFLRLKSAVYKRAISNQERDMMAHVQ